MHPITMHVEQLAKQVQVRVDREHDAVDVENVIRDVCCNLSFLAGRVADNVRMQRSRTDGFAMRSTGGELNREMRQQMNLAAVYRRAATVVASFMSRRTAIHRTKLTRS